MIQKKIQIKKNSKSIAESNKVKLTNFKDQKIKFIYKKALTLGKLNIKGPSKVKFKKRKVRKFNNRSVVYLFKSAQKSFF